METETFYGPWRITVTALEALAQQQFVVTGSDNADGAYPGALGTTVDVTGQEWTLEMKWRDHAVFKPSRILRSATFDTQLGLLVTLGADDGPAVTADQDFNDLVLQLQSQDPTTNPNPGTNPYDFTITEDQLTRHHA